jgi:hypothetical protein
LPFDRFRTQTRPRIVCTTSVSRWIAREAAVFWFKFVRHATLPFRIESARTLPL